MVENIILTNKVTGVVLELDMATTTYYILESVDWGQIGCTHHSYKYVNQIGNLVTGTTLEAREDIEIVGWVIAKTEEQMDQRKQMLNGFVNPQWFIELKYKKYAIDFLPNTTIKYGTTMQENNEVMCKFKISGMAPDPLFKETTERREAAAATKAMFHFPLCINAKEQKPPQIVFGLRQPSFIVNVYNKGSMATGMTIVFEAKSTVVNPSLMSVKTQKYFKINKTLTAGEKVTVNTLTGSRKITGFLNGVELNYFKYRDLKNVWLQLEVGDNLFRYDADENVDGLEVYIYFYDKYLEVQQCY